MNRRKILVMAGLALPATFGGCLSRADGPPDSDPIRRLGAAPGVSMSITSDDRYVERNERPFEEWATIRAANHAAQQLEVVKNNRGFAGQGISVGVTQCSLDELDRSDDAEPLDESEFKRGGDSAPQVWHYRHYSRDGELLNEPSVDFETVVEKTPRTFEVEMAFDDRDYRAVLPTICRHGWIQND